MCFFYKSLNTPLMRGMEHISGAYGWGEGFVWGLGGETGGKETTGET